jgi:hypothetical protein
MYAFGDLLLFVAMFGFGSLLPTGLGLYFLRPFTRFWTVLSIAVFIIAGTSLVAVAVLFAAPPQATGTSGWALASFFAFFRLAGAPLFASAYILAALLAPNRSSRWSLLAATGLEAVVGLSSFVHWFATRVFV